MKIVLWFYRNELYSLPNMDGEEDPMIGRVLGVDSMRRKSEVSGEGKSLRGK